jgi:hypothetical protein
MALASLWAELEAPEEAQGGGTYRWLRLALAV